MKYFTLEKILKITIVIKYFDLKISGVHDWKELEV